MRGGLSVVVVDENWLVRLGLTSLLHEDDEFGPIVEVSECAAALAAVEECSPALVISEIHLPDGSGIDLCREIRRAHSSTRVLFVTNCRDEDIVISAMQAGAHGYVLKNNDPRRLLADVSMVAGGTSVLDAPISDIVTEWMRRAARQARTDRMSEHERRILPLIAQGKTNREIAAELYLSEHTIKTYVSALLKKLQLARRAEAAAYIARQEHVHAV